MAIFYKINDKTFNNQFLAHYEAFKHKGKIAFYCNDGEYDKACWDTEPEESFEFLMDLHAIRLRNKYEYLVLNWSGGTDSHTIYNVFKRNKIHINEIVVKYSLADSEFFPKANADWIKNNHWDKATKITLISDQDSSIRDIILTNEDWIFSDTGGFRRYGFSGIDATDIKIVQDIHGVKDWGIITGYEKPKVYTYNNRWYASMPDYSLRAALGHLDNIECFFLEPMIHIKQSHMLKNFLKSRPIPMGNRYKLDYYTEANAAGRHEELSLGVSLDQKTKNQRNQKDTIIDLNTKYEDFNTNDEFLKEKLVDKDPFALKYVKGFYNLKQEAEFWQYLNRNWLTHDNAILSMKPIWSKPYDLGE